MKLLAVDPGLDLAAASLFEFEEAKPYTPRGAALCYRTFYTCETHPEWEMLRRLETLRAWMHDLVNLTVNLVGGHPGLVFFEEPALAGAYARNRKGRAGNLIPASMAQFWQAFAALQLGAHPVTPRRVFRVRALQIAKEARARVVRFGLGPDFAKGPRGGELGDVLDATFLGLYVLGRGIATFTGSQP